MTNFRRALLALITFITGVGLSLGVGGGIASAHSASLTGVTTCLDLKTGTWPVTWTINPTEDRDQYTVDEPGFAPASPGVWVSKVAGTYPNSTKTISVPAATASVSLNVEVDWRDGFTGNSDYDEDTGNVTVNRPSNCPATPVTPAVTYTPPTCFAAGTVVAIPGTGFTWSNNGLDPRTFTATALPGYSLTQSVFGPYAIASIIATDQCKPSYDPTVVVVETPCTAGSVNVTITTTTTTYHAEFINGVWVKVADEPTVVVTYRPLTEGEQETCKPADEFITRRATEDCTTGANTVTVTLYQTNFTWVYVDGVWVKVQDGDEFVVTTAERPLNEAEQKECQPADEYTTRADNGECSVGDNTVTVTEYRTNFTWAYVDGEWVKSQDGDEFVTGTHERTLSADEIISCVPTRENNVVVDNGVAKCGDTTVATTTTTTTYTYTYEEGVWVEHSTVTVTHGSRAVVTEPCPTTTTVVPPTTVSIAPDVPLPKTGGGLSGLGIGGILFGAGTLLSAAALRRRKVRNA